MATERPPCKRVGREGGKKQVVWCAEVRKEGAMPFPFSLLLSLVTQRIMGPVACLESSSLSAQPLSVERVMPAHHQSDRVPRCTSRLDWVACAPQPAGPKSGRAAPASAQVAFRGRHILRGVGGCFPRQDADMGGALPRGQVRKLDNSTTRLRWQLLCTLLPPRFYQAGLVPNTPSRTAWCWRDGFTSMLKHGWLEQAGQGQRSEAELADPVAACAYSGHRPPRRPSGPAG